MYKCSQCDKNIDVCQSCKQQICDDYASIIYQIAAALFLIALIFFALEIKIKEEIELALRPFAAAAEIAEKKSKTKAKGLPTPPKKEKEPKEAKKKEGQEEKAEISGREADFRVGLWGTSKKKIEEDEKAEKLDRSNPYALEYLARIGNFDAITRYDFSSNRLIGGNYIVFGTKLKKLNELKDQNLIKVGEPCPNLVKNNFSLYAFPRNESLSDIETLDQFFYDMYISLASQHGMPSKNTLGDYENTLSRREKVISIMALDRMIEYEWSGKRSIIGLKFASSNGAAFFEISYIDANSRK